ncbi:NTP/NDP exchange transporter [Pseudomarimonas salicorniae]|uniref:MFS transporter n=1 Tax=Pseudomarimonas salicorniae TaxID=2933270 RepID=A0ABT0GIP9_9GAMM|nr:MFS transporter [Lysobacter sp. CAU 1642]MCK7594074.1 MFS transporter [Lysobacter sp. CAU 1642]
MAHPETTRSGPLHALANLRPGEGRVAALAMAFFFCVLAAYYVLRPIRDAMGVAGGIEQLPWMFLGTLVLTLLLNPLFAAAVARVDRTRLLAICYRALMLCLLVFFGLLASMAEDRQVWIGRAFYWWVSLFNLFAVSLFWTLLIDCLRREQARRLFGLVAAGGTLGALVGAAATTLLVEALGAGGMLLVSALLLEFALRAARGLLACRQEDDAEQRVRSAEVIGGSTLAGFREALHSPYLLALCGFMALYTIGSTFLYFLQAQIISELLPGRDERAGLFAQVDLWSNALTLLAQVFLSSRVLARLGVALTLCLLPLLSTVGYVALGLAPGIGVLIAFQALRRATHFALSVPAREILYFPLSRETRFKAKNLVDTFVFRAGDQLGAWTHTGLLALGAGVAGVALGAAAPLSLLWLALAWWLGRAYQRRTRESTPDTPLPHTEISNAQHTS